MDEGNWRYDKSQIQCHVCRKFDYYVTKCYYNPNASQNANFANTKEKNDNPVLLMANDDIKDSQSIKDSQPECFQSYERL